MARVIAYHRPGSVAEALDLLDAPADHPVVLLGGGTVVNAGPGREPIEVVDLQAAGLGGITSRDDEIVVGATVTLQELADDERVPLVLRRLAVAELPSTLRTLATVGGLVAAAEPESQLLAGLVAFDAVASISAKSGERTGRVEQVVAGGPGGVITSVAIPLAGRASVARTGRTPGDVPIVSAVGHRASDGTLRIAMTGVAATPVVVDDLEALDPPGDFRGSSQYRRSVAAVLAARVERDLQ